jgi:hypothetical protein
VSVLASCRVTAVASRFFGEETDALTVVRAALDVGQRRTATSGSEPTWSFVRLSVTSSVSTFATAPMGIVTSLLREETLDQPQAYAAAGLAPPEDEAAPLEAAAPVRRNARVLGLHTRARACETDECRLTALPA